MENLEKLRAREKDMHAKGNKMLFSMLTAGGYVEFACMYASMED